QMGEEAKPEQKPAVHAAAATGALMTTAHVIESPEQGARPANVEKPSKPESTGATATAAGSIAFRLIFNVMIFIALPLLLTNFLFIHFGWGNAPQISTEHSAGAAGVAASGASWYQEAWMWLHAYLKPVRPSVAFNLVDGLIRMIFFIGMIFSFSRLNDIKRVFEYHGAEHKTVFAWEAGEELTVANARRHPRQHPRCGTRLLKIVMLVSDALVSAAHPPRP